MSFGYGVGDFITVFELSRRLRRKFLDAPGEFKVISHEYAILPNFYK